MDKGKLQPALLGGLFIGVMSALPIINMANCCCCMWVIGGGVLAVYLRQQNQSTPLTPADGALLGLVAGAIGGVVGALISIPVQMMMGPLMQEWMNRAMAANQDMPPEMRDILSRFGGMTGFAVVGAIINIFIYTIFGLLGGLLGVAIFKKNVPPPPPPPNVTTIPYDPGIAQ